VTCHQYTDEQWTTEFMLVISVAYVCAGYSKSMLSEPLLYCILSPTVAAVVNMVFVMSQYIRTELHNE